MTLKAGENALGHGDIQSALDAIDELDRLIEHLAPILPIPVHRIACEDLVAGRSVRAERLPWRTSVAGEPASWVVGGRYFDV